jgi:hypothetical protein
MNGKAACALQAARALDWESAAIFEPADTCRLRVFDLDPGLAWPRSVGTGAILADDALAAKPAGMGEDRGSVVPPNFLPRRHLGNSMYITSGV